MTSNASRRLTVVGAGTMGHGIAEVAAVAGHEVTLQDVDLDLAREGVNRVAADLEGAVERGEMTAEERSAALARIEPTDDPAEAAEGTEFVIEAVPERVEVKRSVYRSLTPHLPESAVLATNTSSLSITDLAGATDKPERFVGMHFFNPPTRMRLVEVVRGADTSDETVTKTEALAKRFDKEPVRVRTDSPGFVVNRVLLPLLNDAAWLVENETASMAVAEATGTHELGLPMGPFELLDFIGLDVTVDILAHMHEELGTAYEPCPLLSRKVDAGDLGRKTDRGFFEYPAGPPDPAPADASEAVATRFVAVMANEVAKLLDAGVAPVEEIDRAMRLGAGFPEGPATIADKRGVGRLYRTLTDLYAGGEAPRYEPSPYLADLAESGAWFRGGG